LKGLPGAARVKDVIMEETGRDKLVEILDQYISSLDEEELTSIAGGSQTAH
jgi:predicted CopG family antitoxin